MGTHNPRTLAQRFCRYVSTQVEELERRTLLSELTVITHGLQLPASFPDWVYDLATAINDRTGYDCSSDQIRLSRREANLELFERQPTGGCKELLLFDWADESSIPDNADADHVAGRLAEFVRDRLPSTGQINLHFIGHSRGVYVNRAAIGRLTAEDDAKVGFIQMTTLDPQPGGGDGVLNIAPNVNFADNYYQQTGGLLEPAGHPV